MNRLNQVIEMVQRGLYVYPIVPNGKKEIIYFFRVKRQKSSVKRVQRIISTFKACKKT